jgi:hypothetical protein
MVVSKKNISRSRSRSRSRSNKGYLKSKLVGGFLRSGTPQFSVYSGTNPLTRYAPYEVINNTAGQKCQNGGRIKSKSNKNKNKYKRQSAIYYKYM